MKKLFKDIEVGNKIQRGSLVWTKTEPASGYYVGLKPQNVIYIYSDPRVHAVHTDHISDDELVEVVEEQL